MMAATENGANLYLVSFGEQVPGGEEWERERTGGVLNARAYAQAGG